MFWKTESPSKCKKNVLVGIFLYSSVGNIVALKRLQCILPKGSLLLYQRSWKYKGDPTRLIHVSGTQLYQNRADLVHFNIYRSIQKGINSQFTNELSSISVSQLGNDVSSILVSQEMNYSACSCLWLHYSFFSSILMWIQADFRSICDDNNILQVSINWMKTGFD